MLQQPAWLLPDDGAAPDFGLLPEKLTGRRRIVLEVAAEAGLSFDPMPGLET